MVCECIRVGQQARRSTLREETYEEVLTLMEAVPEKVSEGVSIG